MALDFQLTETAGAKKSLKVSPELRAMLKSIAKETADTELDVGEFSLSIVCMTDDELLDLNRTVLSHDYYTDILTFEIERGEDSLEAELYFSVDRAKENAKKLRIPAEFELLHLCVHGILHLAGYDDHDPQEKKRMVLRERFFLKTYRNRFGS